MSQANNPAWLRTQQTLRKLLLKMDRDSLVYAKSALENEASAPERLTVFRETARKHFDGSDARS